MKPWTLAALLAASLAAAPAHADPPAPLPPGWIAGGPSSRMTAAPPPAPRSREALQLAQGPLREAIAPVSLALADLETVDLGPAPTAQEIASSNADPPGEAPPDLFVAPGCSRASVSGQAIGTMTVDWRSQPIGPQSSLGPTLDHLRGGDGKHLYVRASWETIERVPDGTLRFTESVARFHVMTCKAKLARRYTAIARPILGGMAYVFRARCAACAAGERDQLHLITAAGEGVDEYDHSILRLDDTGSLRRTVSRARAERFARTIGRAVPTPPVDMNRMFGIEVAKGAAEIAPSVIAYTTDVRPPRFF